MRKLSLILLAFLALCLPSRAQNSRASLTAQGSTCGASPLSSLVQNVSNSNGGATFTLSGTWSGTLSFYATGDGGTTWVALNVTPSNSTSAVTTTTANGTWQTNIAGYSSACILFSTYSSGTAVATIQLSTASARAGGGSGGAPSGPAGGAAYGSYPNFNLVSSTASSNYTVYLGTTCTAPTIVGTTICARNNLTGLVDYSGTDLRVVWDDIVGAIPSGGIVNFKNGIYPCNSLDQESTGGFSNYYCVGIPGSVSSGQYAQWTLVGEGGTPLIDQFGTGVQTNGVVFHLTSTAVSSVAAHSKIMIIWARPDTVNGVGPTVTEQNIDLRVPTNQRGCETDSDLNNALNATYVKMTTDTDVAQSSLQVPVEDTCTAWGATDPGGLIGLVTTANEKQANYVLQSVASASDVGIDDRSEHTVLVSSGAIDGNHGIDYGFRGTHPIYHSSSWINPLCGEIQRCLTLGANISYGTRLDIVGFDLEDKQSGTFLPVYHAMETNAGFTSGNITYSNPNGVDDQTLANFFDGGGGAGFTVTPFSPVNTAARNPSFDSFSRPNSAVLGGAWKDAGYSTIESNQLLISSNAVTAVSGQAGVSLFVGQPTPSSDQFSSVTLSISSNSNTAAHGDVWTNASTNGTPSGYQFFCAGTTTMGSGIQKWSAGTGNIVLQQTSVADCPSGTSIMLRRVGAPDGTVWLYMFKNSGSGWVLDPNLSPNPYHDTSSVITGGVPAIEVASNVTSLTNWAGGQLPLATYSGSLYGWPMVAPAYGTLGNCAAVGTSASPSVASCGSAAAGHFSCATAATGATCQVNTTAVTANSEIFVFESDTSVTGTALGVTCNTSTTVNPTTRLLASSVAGTSFTINLGTVTTNPACFSYHIVN